MSTDSKSTPRVHQAEAPGNALLQGQPHLCTLFRLPMCEVLVVHNAQRVAERAYLPPRVNMVGDTRHPSRHSVWRRSFHPLC